VVAIIEADDARVVLKDADAPVIGTEAPAHFLRRREDRLLEQVAVTAHLSVVPVELDGPPERLVRAVLRPRLRQRLQLDVGGVAAQRPEMRLNGAHLLPAQ